MKRRTALGGMMAAGAAWGAGTVAGAAAAAGGGAGALSAPVTGNINVAFLLSPGATVIDFAGPWEVFQDVHVDERGDDMDAQMPFRLYTVAETRDPVQCTGGMVVVPNHTLQDAPPARVVVVGAQRGRTPAILDWLRAQAKQADVLMSVCTGAFQLGRAGLLDGLESTTHHGFYDQLEREVPRTKVRRGLRFVEGPRISTAGGLTSGVDLALRVVERYFGRAVAQRTADYMEYTSSGWKV